MGLIGGVNTYTYAGSSPIDLLDQTGLVGYLPPGTPQPNTGWPM
jgi:hypothetical protein